MGVGLGECLSRFSEFYFWFRWQKYSYLTYSLEGNEQTITAKLLTHMYMCVNSFLLQERCNFFSPLCMNNLAAQGIKASQHWLGS